MPDLTWRERMNTLNERTARGTQKYASKQNKDEATQDAEQDESTVLERKRAGM